MAVEIIGRDAELAALRAFVERPVDGPAALVLEGVAGIGKSTLWLAGVEAAREHGLTVLVARPAEAEQALALAGLADLLDGAVDDVLPELSSPQRRALEVALLIADADEAASLDPRALGVALRSALRVLAQAGAVVVAVDDVQWLDGASASALEFALRRLDDGTLRLLLSRRGEPTSVEAALDAERTTTVRVEPLSAGAIHGLVRSRLGRTFPRPMLLRLHEASGGNPFYALELARALDRRGDAPDPFQPLHVPPTLEGLVGARLRSLPVETREALLMVAVVGAAATELLDALGVTLTALDSAVEGQVLEITAGVARFTHPLLASEAVALASEDDRRDAHRLVAAAVEEPLTRAVHVAAALAGPDAETADELESAARTASARGAVSLAAQLGEAALRATPLDRRDDRRRRTQQAARDHLAGGSAGRAFVLAQASLDEEATGPPRAEVLALLGDLEGWAGDQTAAAGRWREALVEADAPRLQSAIHARLAQALRITETLGGAEPHAREALRLAEQVGDDALIAQALATLAILLFNGGDPESFVLAERSLALARGSGDAAALDYALDASGHCAYHAGRTEQARLLFSERLRNAEDRDEPATASALWFLALIEVRAGRLALARAHAERSFEITTQYGAPGIEDEPGALFPLANAALFQGEHELTRELSARAVAYAEARGGMSTGRANLALLGMLDRWEGRSVSAVERLETAVEALRAAGFSRSVAFFAGEHVEALLEVGRDAEAIAALEDWAAMAERLEHVWATAQIARCRGLVAASASDVEAAVELLKQAVDAHEAALDPFGRGRALLALGQTRRRLKQKRAAREAIEGAVAQFEEIGAAWWAERARAELGSIGGRTRSDGLSPAELRVAKLVAEGRTNREVAAALFVGERTVETHLSHVYAKLGIRSRTELARALPS